MSDVEIRYLDSQVDIESVTQTDHRHLFDGAEIVIAGKLKDNTVNTLDAVVSEVLHPERIFFREVLNFKDCIMHFRFLGMQTWATWRWFWAKMCKELITD